MNSQVTISSGMAPLLDSNYSTWSWKRSDTTYPVQMIYIRDFSDDKTKAFTRTFNWNNEECLAKSQSIAESGCIASLQRKPGNEIYLVVSEKLKPNFSREQPLKVVYQDEKSETEICNIKNVVFLDSSEYRDSAEMFKDFLIEAANRVKAQRSSESTVVPRERIRKNNKKTCTIL